MKKNLFPFCLCIFLASCSTDFNTVAPYKETMIVYGLLNPFDHINYIKINKAFLGEGNALIMAQQKDSINYADILNVKMERVLNGTVVESHQLTRIDTIPLDPGIFSNPYQVLYGYNDPIYPNAGIYKITITNTKTGVVAYSQTAIVDSVTIRHPVSYRAFKFAEPLPFTIDFNPTDLGVIYNVTLRIHYKETNTSSGISIMKYFDWNLGDRPTTQDFSLVVEFKFNPSDFYNQVAFHVPFDASVYRSLDSLDGNIKPLEVMFTSASQDLYTYELLTGPSYGLVQERPIFSNIQNGIGLFTSRNVYSEWLDIDSSSVATLATNSFTKTLNFH